MILSTINTKRNIVTHQCWDNFDMREETPSGYGTTHTAHGIIIQEASRDDSGTSFHIPASFSRMKGRSTTSRPKELEPHFMKGKVKPHLIIGTTDVPNSQAKKG